MDEADPHSGRGRGRSEDASHVLEELLREDGCTDLGRRCNGSFEDPRLPARACRSLARGGRLLGHAGTPG